MLTCSLRVQPDVDILVNCAGITQRSLLVRTTQESIKDILDTNLLGTINGCKHFSQHWISQRRRDCCIINISSLLAVKGSPGTTVYAASKAGMIGTPAHETLKRHLTCPIIG